MVSGEPVTTAYASATINTDLYAITPAFARSDAPIAPAVG
jgi:hypothetical protein